MPSDAIQEISDWVIDQALENLDIESLLIGFCERVHARITPIDRCQVGFSSLHPMFTARTLNWRPGQPLEINNITFSEEAGEDFLHSPVKPIIDRLVDDVRHRLDRSENVDAFPLLVDLQNQDFTDYIALGRMFSRQMSDNATPNGMVASFATREKHGFSDPCIAALRRLFPRLAVAVKVAQGRETAENIVNAFMGKDPGRRVLDGHIRLGDADLIPSVIYFLDLQGSTMLAEQLGPMAFLGILNRFFEAAAQPILDNGGHILRYIGDSALAAFPIQAKGSEQHGRQVYPPIDACTRALEAVRQGQANVAALNTQLIAEGNPAVSFTVGLHLGDVLFANIGVPERVEFTVIGPAANTAARIQSHAKSIHQQVLVSQAIADVLQIDWIDHGTQSLRGVATPIRLFSPATQDD